MEAKIENRPVSANVFTYRQLGFGQAVPGKTLRPVSFRLALEELRQAISEEFNRFSEDSRIDDELHGGDTVVLPLKAFAYPSFDEALAADRAIIEVVLKEYLFFELLNSFLGRNDVTTCRYAVNSLDSVILDGDHATVTGMVYEISPSGVQNPAS